jgi:hypothetical protein
VPLPLWLRACNLLAAVADADNHDDGHRTASLCVAANNLRGELAGLLGGAL